MQLYQIEINFMDYQEKLLTPLYQYFGENLESSAAMAELRRMRNIKDNHLFYHGIRDSLPSIENQFSKQTTVSYMSRKELYLPAIQIYKDIQKMDFKHIQNVLDVLLTAGVECCVYAEGDKQFSNYLDMKDILFSNLKYCYAVEILHYGFIRIQEHEKRKRMLSMHLNFEVGVCIEGSFIKTNISVPTRHQPFYISIYELNNKFYLSIPKESKEVAHPENETFIFEGEQSQSDIYKLIYERYRHRVFYSNFKKQFDLYYNDDVQLDGIDLWATVQLMDAIKM